MDEIWAFVGAVNRYVDVSERETLCGSATASTSPIVEHYGILAMVVAHSAFGLGLQGQYRTASVE